MNKEIDCHHWADGLNELQIAVKGRFGTPLPLRYTPVPFGPPIGWMPVNYLLEVGFTRDVWAHRIDIHAA